MNVFIILYYSSPGWSVDLDISLCFHPLPPVIYCFVYYLWVGHNYCYAHLAGFTALFLLPGEITTTTPVQHHNQYLRQKYVISGPLITATVITVIDIGIDIDVYISFTFTPRLGSSVAQLSVVSVRWTHPQEVSHLDSHPAPGYFQKVGKLCVRAARTVEV